MTPAAQAGRQFPSLPAAPPAPRAARPLRVCIASCEFVGPIRNGGIGTAYTAMAEALAQAGHQVTLFYTPGQHCENKTLAHWVEFYRERGLTFIGRTSDPGLRIDAPGHVVRSYETYRWLKDRDFDLVHFPEWCGDGYYTLLAKHQGLAFSRTLFCVGTHSPTAWTKEANSEYWSELRDLEIDFMERQCVRLADVVVSPCQYMLAWMSDHGFQLPPRSYVQPNILPAGTPASPAPATTDSGRVAELVFFGRLETRKGIELFCDALDRITDAPRCRDLGIVFLGKPATVNGHDSRSYIRNRAGSWPWRWKIIDDFDRSAAMQYLQQPGRLAVMPSLMENSPYTVLECLGQKIPFLASRVGGIPELIAGADLARATFAPEPVGLADLLRQSARHGIRPWKAAFEPAANQAAWVAWHNALRDGELASELPTDAPGHQPLVSVCVSHFNRPQYLAQALASLEAQDYPNFEVIIVDDGSTSPEAKQFLEQLEPRLQQRNWRLVRQENRYLGAARNTGARHACGEYLLFMDDDNFAKPEELSTFVRAARRCNAEIVTSCMDYFQGSEPPNPQEQPVTRWVPLGPAAAVGYYRNCFGDANCLVKRTTFERLGGFTELYGVTHEDWEFLAAASLKGCRVEVIPESLFHYRYSANSMIRSTSQYRNHQRHIRPYLQLVPPGLHDVLLLAQGAHLFRGSTSAGGSELAQKSLPWRARLEAGRILEKLGHRHATLDAYTAALQAAEAADHPVVMLEALLEVGRAFRSLDATRGRELLQLAVRLAESLKVPGFLRAAHAVLAEFDRGGEMALNVDASEVNRQNLPPSAEPLVSIVIPAFNRLDLIRACLKAIADNTPGSAHEVIVVDNGSTDDTAIFLAQERQAGRLRALFNEANTGFAKACNQGAAAARGKYVLFLNNDTEVRPGWLQPLVRTLDHDSRVGAVASKLLFPDLTIQHAGVMIVDDGSRGDPLLARHVFYRKPADAPEASKPACYQALTAACLLVPADLFRELGGFDEEFWNGYEDVDLCFRIQERGRLLVYRPESVVIHHESQSGPERFRQTQQNIARLHAKWLGKVQPDYIISATGEVRKTGAGRMSPYRSPGTNGDPQERPARIANVGPAPAPVRGQSPAAPPLTSIVVLVRNQLAHTQLCLESIAAHTPESHELVVVDNGSTDGTLDFLQQWQAAHPHCTVIRNETNRGFAAGNNQGLAVARGDYLLLLNNDTVVTGGWLSRLLAVFDRHPDTGIAGPVSNNVSGPQQVNPAGYADLAGLPAFAAEWSASHHGQSTPVNRVVGFCLLARRAVIERLGGLDEQFGSGNFEDDDFCIRARLAGFGIRIAQDSFVHHTGGRTFQGENIDYRQAMGRNWELFRAKWQLPAEASLERGYPTPTSVPAGLRLKVPLPALELTHRQNAHHWRELAAPAAPSQPAPGTATNTRPRIVPPAAARAGNLDEAKSMLGRRDHAGAWQATLAALQQRPYHPEAHLLLAEIAAAAGDGTSARQCAGRARELAPGWRAPQRFLQKSFRGGARPDWLKLPDHGGPRLTVCVIARNEEQFLARCLNSVRDLANQVVVVDTGSTDRTLDIARELGAELRESPWADDFSAPRNTALEAATGDWILFLDADEELSADGRAALGKHLHEARVLGWRLPLVEAGREAEGSSFVPRLFRNAPGLFYTGRIHEQLFDKLEARGREWGLAHRLGEATLIHYGYTAELTRDRRKVERNLRLLRLALEEAPGDAQLLMQLGLELARSGQETEALTQYRAAFRSLSALPADQRSPELRETLLSQYCTRLAAARDFDEITRVLTSPLAQSQTGLSASLHFDLGLACLELGRFSEAADQMRLCLKKRRERSLCPVNHDIRTAAPYHCLALSEAQLGHTAAADNAFQAGLKETGHVDRLRLDYARFLWEQNRSVEALERLHSAISENANDLAAWRLGGQIALSRPEFLEFARDWSGEAMRHLPSDRTVQELRAETLMLSQETAAAASLWRALQDADPQPRFVAARLLCDIVDASSLPVTLAEGADVPAISRAFLEWYRRCLNAGAGQLVARLSARLEILRATLPEAARVIEAALAAADA